MPPKKKYFNRYMLNIRLLKPCPQTIAKSPKLKWAAQSCAVRKKGQNRKSTPIVQTWIVVQLLDTKLVCLWEKNSQHYLAVFSAQKLVIQKGKTGYQLYFDFYLAFHFCFIFGQKLKTEHNTKQIGKSGFFTSTNVPLNILQPIETSFK